MNKMSELGNVESGDRFTTITPMTSSTNSSPHQMIYSNYTPRHQVKDSLTIAFNEEDEDDENEDEMYRNFVENGPIITHPNVTVSKSNRLNTMDLLKNVDNSVGQNGYYGPYGQLVQSSFGMSFNEISIANNFFAKSYPPPSIPLSHYNSSLQQVSSDQQQLSASFIQSTKQLSFDCNSPTEDSDSSNNNIFLCYWIDCYKQFTTQSQLVHTLLLINDINCCSLFHSHSRCYTLNTVILINRDTVRITTPVTGTIVHAKIVHLMHVINY